MTALGSVDWSRVLNRLGLIVLLVITVPFIVFTVPQLVGATGSYIVVSESMNAPPAPTLAAGDVVFVYDTPPEQIKAGDVITYESSGETTTHRVVEVQDEGEGLYFKTIGDANEEADPELVPASRVVGTVGFSLPFLGRALVALGTQQGIVAFILVPLALLVVLELADIVKELRMSESERSSASDLGEQKND